MPSLNNLTRLASLYKRTLPVSLFNLLLNLHSSQPYSILYYPFSAIIFFLLLHLSIIYLPLLHSLVLLSFLLFLSSSDLGSSPLIKRWPPPYYRLLKHFSKTSCELLVRRFGPTKGLQAIQYRGQLNTRTAILEKWCRKKFQSAFDHRTPCRPFHCQLEISVAN